jgi:hypothetical protein
VFCDAKRRSKGVIYDYTPTVNRAREWAGHSFGCPVLMTSRPRGCARRPAPLDARAGLRDCRCRHESIIPSAPAGCQARPSKAGFVMFVSVPLRLAANRAAYTLLARLGLELVAAGRRTIRPHEISRPCADSLPQEWIGRNCRTKSAPCEPCGRDHVEQGVRSCLGILRLATRYPGEQLEAACVRAMAAGASSSGFVEHLLKSGRPLVDPVAEDGVGHHGNIRGPGYYH